MVKAALVGVAPLVRDALPSNWYARQPPVHRVPAPVGSEGDLCFLGDRCGRHLLRVPGERNFRRVMPDTLGRTTLRSTGPCSRSIRVSIIDRASHRRPRKRSQPLDTQTTASETKGSLLEQHVVRKLPCAAKSGTPPSKTQNSPTANKT